MQRVQVWCNGKLSDWIGVMNLFMCILNLAGVLLTDLLFPQSHLVGSASDVGAFCDNSMIISSVTLFVTGLTFGFDFVQPLGTSRHYMWQMIAYLSLAVSANLFSFVWLVSGLTTECGPAGFPALVIASVFMLANASILTILTILFRQWRRYASPGLNPVQDQPPDYLDADVAAAMEASLAQPQTRTIFVRGAALNAEDIHGILDAQPPPILVTIRPHNPTLSEKEKLMMHARTVSTNALKPAPEKALILPEEGKPTPEKAVISALQEEGKAAETNLAKNSHVESDNHSNHNNNNSKHNDNNANVCVICLEDLWRLDRGGQYESVKQVAVCAHRFHAKCLMPWLLKHYNICPLCRKTALTRHPQQQHPK